MINIVVSSIFSDFILTAPLCTGANLLISFVSTVTILGRETIKEITAIESILRRDKRAPSKSCMVLPCAINFRLDIYIMLHMLTALRKKEGIHAHAMDPGPTGRNRTKPSYLRTMRPN